jgi:ankyrin repeat protein
MSQSSESPPSTVPIDDVNNPDKNGDTLLHHACTSINTTPLDTFIDLIRRGGNLNKKNNQGDSPLHLIFLNLKGMHGIEVVEYLLSQSGIDINSFGYLNATILQEACKNVDLLPLSTFKLLIEVHGADINAQNDDEESALDILFTYLKSTQQRKNSHHWAAPQITPNRCVLPEYYSNDGLYMTHILEVLNYLLRHTNVDVNTPRQHGRTLFHQACINVNNIPLKIFECLVECNADLNIADRSGMYGISMALMSYRKGKNGEIIDILKYIISTSKMGINEITRYDGISMLHSACGNILHIPSEFFHYLITEKQADICLIDVYGYTPLHLAFRSNNSHNWSVFNQLDIDLNPQIDQTDSAIVETGEKKYASIHSHLKLMTFLLQQHGIIINGDNNELYYKIYYEMPSAIELPEQFTKYLLANELIPDKINANRYLTWLCCHDIISLQAITLLCENIKVDFFSPTHKSSFLCTILKKKGITDDQWDEFELIDDTHSRLIDYLIEMSLQE